MEPRGESVGENDQYVSGLLQALAVPNRLALLRALAVPRAIGEIEIAPSRAHGELSPDRALSRAAVHEHLAKLRDARVVDANVSRRDSRDVTLYTINRPQLFALVEELRALLAIPGVEGDGAEPTQSPHVASRASRGGGEGPALVATGGPLDGRAFALEGDGPWTIGRSPEAHVRLWFDPFVSKENAVVARVSGALRVRGNPDARNGTRVNWRPLAAGEVVELSPGDVLGVGRSYLVVRGGA